MANNFRKDYDRQLPKLKRINWLDIGRDLIALSGVLIGAGSISLVVFEPQDIPSTIREIALFAFFPILVILLLAYIWYREHKKLHRYAQSVFYFHLVNHIVRDYLGSLVKGEQKPISEALTEILDSISTCFSIISGTRCRVCVKEINREQLTVSTTCRDTGSRHSHSHVDENNGVIHEIERNTDFSSVWYGLPGNYRYFYSNDLIKMYREHNYENSSFLFHGKPKLGPRFWPFRTNWPLPYKTAIVLPIRYIREHSNWPPNQRTYKEFNRDMGERAPGVPDIYGFLCIDANSRNVFDTTLSPEMGAVFADILYTLFSQSDYILCHKDEES
jgi:hypothetical protein